MNAILSFISPAQTSRLSSGKQPQTRPSRRKRSIKIASDRRCMILFFDLDHDRSVLIRLFRQDFIYCPASLQLNLILLIFLPDHFLRVFTRIAVMTGKTYRLDQAGRLDSFHCNYLSFTSPGCFTPGHILCYIHYNNSRELIQKAFFTIFPSRTIGTFYHILFLSFRSASRTHAPQTTVPWTSSVLPPV